MSKDEAEKAHRRADTRPVASRYHRHCCFTAGWNAALAEFAPADDAERALQALEWLVGPTEHDVAYRQWEASDGEQHEIEVFRQHKGLGYRIDDEWSSRPEALALLREKA